jgi:hypothetical protein
MAIRIRSRVRIGPRPQSQPLLLDLFPNAAVAYSLRKLRNAYSGMAIRVRRSLDNAEEDFGFDSNGDLDGIAVNDFVGYNLAIWSEDLSQTTWSKSASQVSPILINDPLGVASGRVLLETAVTSTHGVSRATTGVGGNTYTVSFWIKAQGRDNFRLSTTTGLNSRQAWLNLATGTIVSQPAPFVNLTITPDINDWYLVSFTETAANATLQISINFSPDGVSTTYLGDITKGMAIWGFQISQTSTVKPYQKTVATAGGNGFVTTWYDHSGSGRNGTQTSAANQCQIVSNGSLIIDPGNGRLSTLFTNDRYSIGFFSLNANNLVSSVYVGNRVSGNIISFGSSNNEQANSFRWLSNNNLSSFGSSTNGTSSLTGDFIAFTQRLGNSDVNMWINNVQQTSGISIINNGPNSFGNSDNTIFNNGYFQEGILWNGNDQSSNRTAIETNINNYYGIY